MQNQRERRGQSGSLERGRYFNLPRLAGEKAEWKFGEGQVVNLLRLPRDRVGG